MSSALPMDFMSRRGRREGGWCGCGGGCWGGGAGGMEGVRSRATCQSGDFSEDCGINDRKILLGIRHSASCVCFKEQHERKS